MMRKRELKMRPAAASGKTHPDPTRVFRAFVRVLARAVRSPKSGAAPPPLRDAA